VSRSRRPPIDPEAARELIQPTQLERGRIRENIDRSLARGSASQTVLRVDASMAERALGGAFSSAGLFGSKLAIAKLLIPALLIGAGVGAIWARTLFDHGLTTPPENQSLPVAVEDLDPLDPPATDLRVAAAAGNAVDGPVADSASSYQLPAAPPKPLAAHAARPHRRARPERDARSSHARADEAAPPPAQQTLPAPVPEGPSHHLAEELRLMRAASAALAANEIQRTLDLLSHHAERFPDGALREERRALRVISLCKQGRSHFALAERDEFLSSSPRSPLTARVREACESRQ
jgi:hypothetical protein